MPTKPKKPCKQPGCPNLTTVSYCDDHKKEERHYDRQRGTAAQRGYDSKWQKARKGFLSKHPLCIKCQEQSKVTPAEVVDHIIPHKGDKKLFWDRSNWQPLCNSCHSKKTRQQDMGSW